MAFFRTCDGVARRDFLKAGVVGGSGLSLASYAQLVAASNVNPEAKAKSAIFVNLNGGPSHMDTFDPKPDAPSEYRGEFNTIQTCRVERRRNLLTRLDRTFIFWYTALPLVANQNCTVQVK